MNLMPLPLNLGFSQGLPRLRRTVETTKGLPLLQETARINRLATTKVPPPLH